MTFSGHYKVQSVTRFDRVGRFEVTSRHHLGGLVEGTRALLTATLHGGHVEVGARVTP